MTDIPFCLDLSCPQIDSEDKLKQKTIKVANLRQNGWRCHPLIKLHLVFVAFNEMAFHSNFCRLLKVGVV
jgi:hypothetical protein